MPATESIQQKTSGPSSSVLASQSMLPSSTTSLASRMRGTPLAAATRACHAVARVIAHAPASS